MRRRKNAVHTASFALILVAATIFVLEAVSLGLLHFSERWPSRAEIREALDQVSRESTGGTARVGDTAPHTKEGNVLHPYIGFVRKDNAGGPNRVNNRVVDLPVNEYGFFGDSPFSKSSDSELIIALTGGSVATELFLYGRETLRRELASSPAFADREIRVVSLALGGFKQPQQLMALNYFLALGAPLDIVVNLDGFNEVVLPFSANVPLEISPYYPFRWRSLAAAAIDPETAALVGRILEARETFDRMSRAFAHFPLRQSSFCLALWQVLSERSQARATAMEVALRERLSEDEPPGVQERGPTYSYTSLGKLFSDSVEMWKRSSLQMWRLCEASGITYLHFLQPNQYVPHSKPLTALERKITEAPGPNLSREGVRKGYPLLISEGRSLREMGLPFFDLTRAFQGERGRIYRDACCHFSQRGYEIVAESIASAIRSLRDRTP